MKKILLIATGGTIASAEDGHGLSPVLTGAELAACVPEIEGICELDVLELMNIDSTNMRPADWMRIRDAIVERYASFDAFLVLHGTDTMAYTAAALSYLIPGNPKPIVLTGSQRPMTSSFTDAKLNLYQSLLYAADDLSRDVCIVFGGLAIAGTRARKQRTMSSNAFSSVNYPPRAYIRGGRIVRSDVFEQAPGIAGALSLQRAATPTKLRSFSEIDDRVAVLKLTPGLNPQLFHALKEGYDALILEIYGLGGIPDYGADEPSFKQAIFDWVDSGRALVLTTQVPEEGLDLGVYEVGRAYADHPGILRGGDMTTEAIVAKMMWALGQTHDMEELERLFYQPVNHDRQPGL